MPHRAKDSEENSGTGARRGGIWVGCSVPPPHGAAAALPTHPGVRDRVVGNFVAIVPQAPHQVTVGVPDLQPGKVLREARRVAAGAGAADSPLVTPLPASPCPAAA